MPTAPDWRALQVRTEKIIASGSNGPHRILVYSWLADGTPSGEGAINSAVFNTSSIGTDVFFYLSGAVGRRAVDGSYGLTLVGGDFMTSGTGHFRSGLSGSHTRLFDGTPAFLGGDNITISFLANGAVAVSSSLSVTGSQVSFGLTDYGATSNTTSTVVGQYALDGAAYSANPIYLRGILAAASASITPSVRLYNATSGAYVHISGSNQYWLTGSGTTPMYLESVNLVSAANFSTSSRHIYELHLSTSNGTYPVYAGGWHFAVSAVGLQGAAGAAGATGAAGGGTDQNASYVVMGLTASLANERALTAGPGVVINDYGAGGAVGVSASLLAGPNITINQVGSAYAISASTVTPGELSASYVVLAATSSLANERVLSAGPGIAINDYGAGGAVGLSASLLAGPNITLNIVGGSYAISGTGFADVSASYVVFAATSSLPNERALAAGPGIAITDGGAGGNLTVSASLLAGTNITINQVGNSYAISSSGGSGGSGDPDASYLVLAATSSLANERVLTAGPGITFVDNGAGSSLIVSASAPRYQSVAAYSTTTSTSSSPQVVGQFQFIPSEHLPSFVRFRFVMSSQSTTASVRVYNLTSGAYVDLAGATLQTLFASNSNPTAYNSVNLVTAQGWSTASAVYEVRLHSATTTDTATLGSGYVISFSS